MNATLSHDEVLHRYQPPLLPATSYRTAPEQLDGLTVTPYSPAVGARVTGVRVDPDHPIAEYTSEALKQALYRYGFLAFEPGTVAAEHFIELIKAFGQAEYLGTPHTPVAKESAHVNTIDSKVKKTRMNYIWHIDQSFKPEQPRFTALFGKVVPAKGGSTVFSNATLAYESLDPLFARYLETLQVVQDADTQGYLTLAYGADPDDLLKQRNKYPTFAAPLIRVHPETGAKQIFVSELYTQRILGVSRVTSQNLLGILFDTIKSPEVVSHYQWEEGAVLIWDNRVVQHRGIGDFGNAHRLLLRAVVR